MKFYGTRDKKNLYSLKDAAKMGLAPCGGLFMPEYIPQADMKIVMELADRSYADMAAYLSSLFFGGDLTDEQINNVCKSAYDFDVNLHSFNNDIHTLELFDGPTLAFKDFGARFMSRMLAELFPDKKIKIVTATSGDTGSAVAAGFFLNPAVEVYIMYPKGRVSDFQERQMTTLSENIHALRVDGSFDDCQAMAKEVLGDSEFCIENSVTSANSISLLRWIPQSFYYFWLYAKWKKTMGDKPLVVVVPSGNYGNISAGILAKKMGLPINKFIAASNNNDVIPQFLASGVYSPRESVATLSNAMDVGKPSNYERLMELSADDINSLRSIMEGCSVSDDKTKEVIAEVYNKYQYIIDPHSAIGYITAKENGGGVFLSTAHCSKFKEVIEPIIGVEIEYPEKVKQLFVKQKQFVDLKCNTNDLKKIIANY